MTAENTGVATYGVFMSMIWRAGMAATGITGSMPAGLDGGGSSAAYGIYIRRLFTPTQVRTSLRWPMRLRPLKPLPRRNTGITAPIRKDTILMCRNAA